MGFNRPMFAESQGHWNNWNLVQSLTSSQLRRQQRKWHLDVDANAGAGAPLPDLGSAPLLAQNVIPMFHSECRKIDGFHEHGGHTPAPASKSLNTNAAEQSSQADDMPCFTLHVGHTMCLFSGPSALLGLFCCSIASQRVAAHQPGKLWLVTEGRYSTAHGENS